VTDIGKPCLLGHLLGPPLDRPPFDLNAAAAVAASQVVVMGVGLAPAVQDFAARVPYRVDPARLAKRLQVPVNGREPDLLTPIPEFRVDLLSAAESGQPVEHRGDRFGLPGTPDPGAVRSVGGSAIWRAHISHGSSHVEPLWTFDGARWGED
jgi:hypothetical protein